MDYKSTLNLPQTRFPMKANLAQREPGRIERWEAGDLYHRMVGRNAGKPAFVLHDGPPYANGRIHSGTVLNKILKDFVVKYRNMAGRWCEYIPGWDCHGLPIENKVEQEEGKSKDSVEVADFRRKCRAYAMKYVDIQRDEFKRLGVLGEWSDPYLTLHPSYEATIAREFGRTVAQGVLYKQKRPVYWCAHHVTALAEAEVEYADLTSPSVWVKFEMNESARSRLPFHPAGKKGYVVIWTTTPWTLPANLAITLHPAMEYSLLDAGSEVYLVATELARAFAADCSLPEMTELGIVRGKALEGASCRHPFVERDSLLILGEFVTTETGTGCVHTAPGHGADDFEAGLRYGLDAYAPVDDHGCFTAEVPEYRGRYVFDCDDDIVAMLRARGVLLGSRPLTHSYPVCVRCKKPIVFRATSQWFISMEKSGLRAKTLSLIPGVSWVPPKGEQRIQAMVESRPDWCVSRQRLWGVPLIVFYCAKCRHPVLDEKVVSHVAHRFETEGADAWYVRSAAELVPPGLKCGRCGHGEFTKESDIVDVWFESGVSYAAVIERRYGKECVTDLYLEGSDQHRGWFQSALLESVLTRGRAPFKAVLTHGFVVDGEGKKISKTEGNYIPPEEIIGKYGAEIYRLWTAAENYQEDVRVSDEILRTLVDSYMKIRNTFRFLLGNLDGFDPATEPVPREQMLPVDRYILHRTCEMMERFRAAYESYSYHELYQDVVRFCAVDLSAFYLDILKDRLYVLPKDALARRSARTALYEVLSALVRALAPILSFTCDEVWELVPKRAGDPESVFLTDFPATLGKYRDPELAAAFDRLMGVRDLVKKSLEEQRVKKVIGHPLEAAVTIKAGTDHAAAGPLARHLAALRELFIVSSVAVVTEEGEGLAVSSAHASGEKCVRCWNWSESTGKNAEFPGVCGRCAGVLAHLKGG